MKNKDVSKSSTFLRKIRRRVRNDDLLYSLAEIGVAALAVSIPPLAMTAFVIQSIQKRDRGLSERKIRNSFYSLKRRGLITVQNKHGKTSLILSPEAEQFIQLRNLQKKFEEKKTRRWDGKWFVVMFDINNRNTSARNALRSLLKRFNFSYLQKSAWLYPFDCRFEVEFLRSFFKLSNRELRVLVCSSIGDDTDFRKDFGI